VVNDAKGSGSQMSDIQKRFWSKPAPISADLSTLEKDYLAFMNEALSLDSNPYEMKPGPWCFGLGTPEGRLIEFVFRGRGTMKQYRFEVFPFENNQVFRLGSHFGLREYSCVVVAGIQSVRYVSWAWLNGETMQQVLRSTEFYDRSNLPEPLTPISSDS
jgi:hypothetical protein